MRSRTEPPPSDSERSEFKEDKVVVFTGSFLREIIECDDPIGEEYKDLS